MSPVVLVLQLILEVRHRCQNKGLSWANTVPTIKGQLSNLKIQKFKYKDTQKYNVACCIVWV